VLAKAEEEAQQIRARAREEVDRRARSPRAGAARPGRRLSVELAGKIVQRELDEAQHRELVDQYINELSGLN
jgi:F-type H+-transporting ATPase subunit b